MSAATPDPHAAADTGPDGTAALPAAVVLVPARMRASRLPGKPLAEIAGEPMVVHAWRAAAAAGIGEAVVACDDPAIREAVEAAGGRAVMTRPDHASGSDRIHEALAEVDPDGCAEAVVNLQGDMPLVPPQDLRACLAPLADRAVDIATLVAEIVDPAERDDPNVVKCVGTAVAPGRLRALYFTRATAPWGEGPLLHHVGIYAFRRDALARFVALPPSPLETRERLEQLRALEAGLRIDAVRIEAVPPGVNTPEDLEKVRALFALRGPPAAL